MLKLANNNRNTCGRRAVFINKFGSNKIKVLIKNRYMKRYLRKSAQFDCCYQFLMTPSIGSEHKAVRYTECVKFQDGSIIELQSDYIKVKCYEYEKLNKSREIYDDVYAFTRRINMVKTNFNNCSNRFNVLMIGMDSLSVSKMQQTMTKTVKFFKENFWLSYRAYHKVDDNTFQNLIALLTGMRFETLHQKCSKKMDDCKDLFIWNKFKDIGYVTAYVRNIGDFPIFKTQTTSCIRN
ncbi:hypothetical protein K1T71_003813 [Dendrolimus kikuchii]|uniref:Uncharacterized protein n=1 Tax=Dendrolimus kikuchii TaxID=765133 RepID=A0ACC1D8V9_9NEOP|nr:hypothetical protein K1T71_003813 [Dendrolimus kikuchii]